MQKQVIININCLANVRNETKVLRGKELSELPCISNAYLIIEDGVIIEFGEMKNLKLDATNDSQTTNHKLQTINANGATLLPCWCDSHTHLVFAASREEEFVDKIKGKTYAEIASKGGGILNSARKLNTTSEDELFEKAQQRLNELIKLGTGSI